MTETSKVHPARDRMASALCVTVIAFLCFGQRLAIPVGSGDQLSLTTPVLLLAAALGLATGAFVLDAARLVALGTALCLLGALTIVHFARGLQPSIASLALLALIYLPAAARTGPFSATSVERGLNLYAWLMTILAGLGASLFALQYAGLPYRDYLADALPQALLQRDYVTTYPVTFGSDIYRSNGVFFLEASFFSLFLAVGVVAVVFIGKRYWRILVMLTAMATTVSGNGIVFLLACLPFLLAAPRTRRRVIRGLPILVLLGVILAATTVGQQIADRVTEIRSDRSSANSRLITPYAVFAPPLLSNEAALLTGFGAGSVTGFASDSRGGVQDDRSAYAPVVMKLGFEYGLVGALAMLIALLRLFAASPVDAPWASGLFVAYFVLNAGLQQPVLAGLMIVSLAWLPSGSRRRRAPRCHPAGQEPFARTGDPA